MNIEPKESVIARLREYGNRKRTTWEQAALCVAAVSTIEGARDDLWRIAQGVQDPQSCAKAALAKMGIDYNAEQKRINAQHATENCACARNVA